MKGYKYCWLNLHTGKFSNSWTDKDNRQIDKSKYKEARDLGWVLIKYHSLNDDNFKFDKNFELK